MPHALRDKVSQCQSECAALLRRASTESSRAAYRTCKEAAQHAQNALSVYSKWTFPHAYAYVPVHEPYADYCESLAQQNGYLGDAAPTPGAKMLALHTSARLHYLAHTLGREDSLARARARLLECRRAQGDYLLSQHDTCTTENAFAAQAAACYRAAGHADLAVDASSRNLNSWSAEESLPALPGTAPPL